MPVRLILIIVFSFIVSGCSAFGVYDDTFSCPNSYNGRCIGVDGAYKLSLEGKDNAENDPDIQKENKGKKAPKDEGAETLEREGVAHTSYKESLFKKMNNLLKEPDTPVVAPPQVMRMVLLPYKGDANELYMLRHVYFFVDEPKWILGDSVVAVEGE